MNQILSFILFFPFVVFGQNLFNVNIDSNEKFDDGTVEKRIVID